MHASMHAYVHVLPEISWELSDNVTINKAQENMLTAGNPAIVKNCSHIRTYCTSTRNCNCVQNNYIAIACSIHFSALAIYMWLQY